MHACLLGYCGMNMGVIGPALDAVLASFALLLGLLCCWVHRIKKCWGEVQIYRVSQWTCQKAFCWCLMEAPDELLSFWVSRQCDRLRALLCAWPLQDITWGFCYNVHSGKQSFLIRSFRGTTFNFLELSFWGAGNKLDVVVTARSLSAVNIYASLSFSQLWHSYHHPNLQLLTTQISKMN